MPDSQRADCHDEPLSAVSRYWRMRRILPLVLLIDTAIAAFLWVVTSWSFRSTFIRSQAIGLSFLALQYAGHHWIRREERKWLVTAVTVPLGALLGTVLGAAVDGTSPRDLFSAGHPTLAIVVYAAVFGVLVTLSFAAGGRILASEARLRDEQLRRASAGRALAEAELKLLQAQIEPHFLFNTLSHVIQLVDDDPARARRMLVNLTSYLRGSLRRTRAGATTLGEELDLVRAYLEIQAVRMRERLAWTVQCADGLRDRPFPPLLLQPLVENALRHGLEPKPGGGRIAVTAAREGETLVLEVHDDGLGLDPHRPPGVGLANVRERVRLLTGGAGTVTLRPVEPSGLCVRIAFPFEAALAPAPADAPGAATP